MGIFMTKTTLISVIGSLYVFIIAKTALIRFILSLFTYVDIHEATSFWGFCKAIRSHWNEF